MEGEEWREGVISTRKHKNLLIATCGARGWMAERMDGRRECLRMEGWNRRKDGDMKDGWENEGIIVG